MADHKCSFRVLTGLPSRNRVRARFHFGFTLIELLVVIAVIAIVAAILFPVMTSARSAGTKAKCANHLKQLAAASILYADDNNSHFVPAAPDIFDDGAGGLRRWHGARASVTEPFDPKRGPLWPYMGRSSKLKECPLISMLKTLSEDEGAFESGGGGYGYNQNYIGGSYYKNSFSKAANVTPTIGEVRRPSKTVMFTDSAMALSYPEPHLIEYSFCEPPLRIFGGNVSTRHNSPSVHFRHADTATVAWVDGHVSAEKMSFTTPINDYQADNRASSIGWFGPDDNSLFDLE